MGRDRPPEQMAQNYKRGPAPASQPTLFSLPLQPQERERVAQLIALNKSDQALDFAKEVHRRCHSSASEALLLDVYGVRVASLMERKLEREARALMDLVRERYPSSRERLAEWEAVIAARQGDLSALLAPLNDPSLAAEKQAAIAGTVRRDEVDLQALAECRTLAAEHPWRAAAIVLWRAFEAVTSGPLAEEAVALPEIPRSSPLAPWKMLIRAIAAYYRRDDGLCEKFLAAIEPDSAAARLAPSLRAAMHHPQTLSPPAASLVSQIGGNLESLRAALKRLDSALDRRNQASISQEIPQALAACRQAEPGLLDRLKQHIAIRAMLAGLKHDKLAAVMGGPALANAYYWRLMARVLEEATNDPMALGQACNAWEEFRKHAVQEGWFPAKGPETATVYLHMADQLRHLGSQDLHHVRADFARHFDGNALEYRGQPPEIRALMSGRLKVDLYFLSPPAVLERACEADPCAENFQRWLRYAEESAPGTCDLVAERWSQARPQDIPPLLRLMESAEKRNALQKAFKLMERAEQIDGLNAEVRRARLRLLVSMAVRHLRENKPKLAEKDLRQIEALPQAQQGDRPAFVAALRYLCGGMAGAQPAADAARAEVVRLMGDKGAAQILILEVERWCGCSYSEIDKSGRTSEPTAAFGRVCVLGEDMGMPVALTPKVAEAIMWELSAARVSASPRALSALGEVALREDQFPLAYTIAGAGLAQGAESQARFLFLRARSLPPWEDERRSSCLAAASELARRQHDADTLKRIGAWRDEELDPFDVPSNAQAALSSEEIGRVVQREIQERSPSSSRPPIPAVADDDDECQCPACCAERGEMPPELAEMVDQFGPDLVAQAMAEIFGFGGKKKRGRRRPLFDGIDFPF